MVGKSLKMMCAFGEFMWIGIEGYKLFKKSYSMFYQTQKQQQKSIKCFFVIHSKIPLIYGHAVWISTLSSVHQFWSFRLFLHSEFQ